ncbi:MAG: hypothetical protein NTZ57_08045, partial [Deltaproteobacteria bacterium]|nr:hypothetical protein [Deltaproteobacteria bacterium]
MEQSEIDAMLKGIDQPEALEVLPKSDDDLQWDDVQNEMEQSKTDKPSIAVSPAVFEEVQKGDTPRQVLDLDFVLDIPLSLTVE